MQAGRDHVQGLSLARQQPLFARHRIALKLSPSSRVMQATLQPLKPLILRSISPQSASHPEFDPSRNKRLHTSVDETQGSVRRSSQTPRACAATDWQRHVPAVLHEGQSSAYVAACRTNATS